MPGVPRATYMPFPFQIVQGSSPYILMAYEFTSATRTIRMNWKGEAPTDAWMGWSRGRWEGDTLVVDVTGMREETWFDRAGDFHSDALHVVERYTPLSPYHLMYEATIEDPEGVHAAMEDELPAVSTDGKEHPAAGIQVRAVHRRNAVREVSQEG